jgi:hypothetical protein
MKLPPDIQVCSRRMRPSAFTLAEMYISLAIFAFVIAATVAIQYYGLNIYYLSATKLTATTSGRQTINTIRNQILGAVYLKVGTYSNAAFNQVTNGAEQIGNAIKIYPTTNATPYTIFYMQPGATGYLNSVTYDTNNNAGPVTALASGFTNYLCFQAEGFSTNNNGYALWSYMTGSQTNWYVILTNSQNNRVIHMTLHYYQWAYPVAQIGNVYDYYTLQTRATRRDINGSPPN